MINGLQSAAAVLQSAIGQAFGVTATYTRSSSSARLSVPWTASPGKSTLFVDDAIAGRIEVESNDWIGPASALVLGGVAIRPQEGDVIVIKMPSGRTNTYEVMSPPYRPSDSYGTNLRVHTKLVSTS